MSEKTPVRCYVYQPDPPPEAFGRSEVDPRIFALGGPGSELHQGKRYTRKDATYFCEIVNATGQTECCCECGNDYPRADLLAGEIYCPKCRVLEKARDEVLLLSTALASVLNAHGCDCAACQLARMHLFDTRNKFGFKDGLVRSGNCPTEKGRGV